MNLAGLVASFASLAAVDAGSAVLRKVRSLGWYVLAGLLLLTAYIAATAALVTWLATQIALWAAFAVAAGAFAILAGAVLLVAARAENARERHQREVDAARHEALLSAVAAFGGDASTKALISAVMLGMASGAIFRK